MGEIDREINDLGAKARAGQLTPDDMKGSTFTLTNSGVYGSLLFTPIINLPEVAVLGMGKVADAAVVRQGQVVVSKVMYLCPPMTTGQWMGRLPYSSCRQSSVIWSSQNKLASIVRRPLVPSDKR